MFFLNDYARIVLMKHQTFKLGLVGIGKMGTALLGGVLRARLLREDCVFIHDHSEEKCREFLAEFPEVFPCGSVKELSESVDVLIIAVKPYAVEAVLNELSEPYPLLISIAAGVSLKAMEQIVPGAACIRVMPNTPALIGLGAAAYAGGREVTDEQLAYAESLLSSVGFACKVEESHLAAVTAVSGSGPAYMFMILDALADAGAHLGLDRPLALQLATQTMLGAAALVQQSSSSPAELRAAVSSPGGTTLAALKVMEDCNLHQIVCNAAIAAARRAEELQRGC